MQSKTSKVNHSILIYYLALKRFEFDYVFLNKHRDILIKPVVENILKENELKSKTKNQNNKKNLLDTGIIKCDTSFPVCVNDLDKEFQRNVVSFVTMKLNRVNNIIFDEYFGKNNGNKANISNEYDPDDILIERRGHTCGMKEFSITKSNANKFDNRNLEKDADLHNSLRKTRKCKLIRYIIYNSFSSR